MKKKVIAVAVAAMCLVGCTEQPDNTKMPVETTRATTVAETTEVRETTVAERLGVSEVELREIVHILKMHSDYTEEDIELIREGKDVLVEFREYVVVMLDGEVIDITVHESLLEG